MPAPRLFPASVKVQGSGWVGRWVAVVCQWAEWRVSERTYEQGQETRLGEAGRDFRLGVGEPFSSPGPLPLPPLGTLHYSKAELGFRSQHPSCL